MSDLHDVDPEDLDRLRKRVSLEKVRALKASMPAPQCRDYGTLTDDRLREIARERAVEWDARRDAYQAAIAAEAEAANASTDA